MSTTRFKPWHGMVLVLVLGAVMVLAQHALEGGFARGEFIKVVPDAKGEVQIPIGDLGREQVRFYRFINVGNQEVFFFVARAADGHLHVAFDANEICAKSKRGYRHDGGWMTCNKCDKAFRIETINNGGGGCNPVPAKHRVEGERLVLAESAIMEGWRFFR